MTSNNFLREIRNAAMAIASVPHRDAIRGLADDIETSIAALTANASVLNAIHFNAAWSRAAMAMRTIEQTKPPTSTGAGLAEGALIQRVA